MKRILVLLIILESCSSYCQSYKIEILDSLVVYRYGDDDPKLSICIENLTKQSLLFYNVHFTLYAISENRERNRSFTGMAFVLKDSNNHYYSYYFTHSIEPSNKKSRKTSSVDNAKYLKHDTTILVENKYCYKPKISIPDIGLTKGTYTLFLLYNVEEKDIPIHIENSKSQFELDFVGSIKSNIIRVRIF